MSHRQSILFNGATIEGTIVEREGLSFFVEEVKPLSGETNIVMGTKCGVCNRWFRTNAKLRKHHKSHQHPIHCCRKECQFKAAEFKDMLRHVNTNHKSLLKGLTEFDPVECNECGKKYTREDNYHRHKTQGYCKPRTDNFKSPLERIAESSAAPVRSRTIDRNTSIDLTQSFDRLRSNSAIDTQSSRSDQRSERSYQRLNPATKGLASGSVAPESDSDESSDGEMILQSNSAKRTRHGKAKEVDDLAAWRHSTGVIVEETGLETGPDPVSFSGGFSATVLHIPDSTEAMLTAVNRTPDGTYSKQSVMTKEIDIDVPANTMVKLKINLVVKR